MGKGKQNNVSQKKASVTGKDWDATVLAPEDKWLENFDLEGFRKEIHDLGAKLADMQGEEDMKHLNKIVMWSRLCSWIGGLTCWIAINPISIMLLSLGTMSRWTIVGHHVCHGGFDKVDKTKRYNRFKFAIGSVYRRVVDWLDWMYVEAWNQEHNQLHHYHLGELADPDLVEHNMHSMREMNIPLFVKYIVAVWMMLTWKWWYYAPNTYKALKVNELRKNGVHVPEEEAVVPCTIDMKFLLHGTKYYSQWEFLFKAVGPYILVRFILTPLPFYFLDEFLGTGGKYFFNAVVSLVLAEILTNLHSFVIIATNHAGDDLYRFNVHCKPYSGTFYLRQVIGSVNFDLGTDVIDFLHGFLNYQIEHHLWPSLTMRSYQKAAPLVQAICKKYNVPYIKHNVFWRLKKLVDVMVGTSDMRKFPLAYENKEDCE